MTAPVVWLSHEDAERNGHATESFDASLLPMQAGQLTDQCEGIDMGGQ